MLPPLLLLLEKDVPAHVVLALACIANPTVLRFTLSELHYADTFPKIIPRDSPVAFDASLLTEDEKNYINTWIELVFLLISENVSSLTTKKFIQQLATPTRDSVIQALTEFLVLFFARILITSTPSIQTYAKFIVVQMEKKLHQIFLEDIDTGEKVRI